MDEGEDILRESIIVSCMKDATRGPMNGEKGPPVSRKEGKAACTEDGILVGG